MAKSSMTTIVRGLERGGFVRLESDSADHRVKRLWLTPRARELERVLGDGVTRLRHRVTATLGIAGQQQLQQNLQRLLDSL
jgi:DNA-binding MarR family transcriptional regulator